MGPYGPIWTIWVHTDPYGSTYAHMGPYGPVFRVPHSLLLFRKQAYPPMLTEKSEEIKPFFQKDADRKVNMKEINLVSGFILFGMWQRRSTQKNTNFEILGRPKKHRNIIISAELDILGETTAKA